MHRAGGCLIAGREAWERLPAGLREVVQYFEYGAFVTNTADGQVQFLDARRRTQAHVEDRIKQFKACGATNLPSIDYGRNAAWLQLAALATSLTAWLRHLALEGELAKAPSRPPAAPAGRGTGAHPSTLGHPTMPITALPPQNDPQLRRSRSSGSA
ncbi:MAG TPA: hypothetical protein VIY28_08520 [Pseudonocardiaceae bacterium]